MLRDFFYRLESHLALPRINWVKSLYLNFQLLPFSQAVKLPLLVYGKCQVVNTRGKVFFSCPVKKGLIKIGRNTDHFFANQKSLILISNGSSITFNGPATFGSGCTWRLTNNGTITFGEYVRCGSGVRFFSEDKLVIGNYSIITYNCQILNTNFHYILDTNTKTVHRNTKPISIGAFNWIGNQTTVMKGAITKDYTIVASGSLLNKDYVSKIPSNDSILLAGSPAKLVTSGLKRIFSLKNEGIIRDFFKESDSDVFHWHEGMEDTIEDTYILF